MYVMPWVKKKKYWKNKQNTNKQMIQMYMHTSYQSSSRSNKRYSLINSICQFILILNDLRVKYWAREMICMKEEGRKDAWHYLELISLYIIHIPVYCYLWLTMLQSIMLQINEDWHNTYNNHCKYIIAITGKYCLIVYIKY